MSSPACNFLVTCESIEEADKLSDLLLENRLVACAKQVKLDVVKYWWKGSIAKATEVLLILDSREDLFDQVEGLLQKHHSYDTFVLEMIPIQKLNSDAQDWVNDNLIK